MDRRKSLFDNASVPLLACPALPARNSVSIHCLQANSGTHADAPLNGIGINPATRYNRYDRKPAQPLEKSPPAATAGQARLHKRADPFPHCQENTPMSQALQSPPDSFLDRRSYDVSQRTPAVERRQFADSYEELSPEAQELGRAVDEYKLRHRRRFITYEETLALVKSLGYHK